MPVLFVCNLTLEINNRNNVTFCAANVSGIKSSTMKTKFISTLPFFFFALSASAQEVPGKSAETASAFTDVKLFPNPTSEIIFIRNGDLIESYQVMDMQGRVVQAGQRNAQIISLIDVPIGYYFIEMKIGDEMQRVRVQKY